MNFKRSTTSMGLVLMALSLISMTAIQQDVFAQSQGMAIIATADKDSDTITVTGKTVSDSTDITLKVTSPSGYVVDIGQIPVDNNGMFTTEFIVGPTWVEDGFYEITASQGVHTNSLYTLNVLVKITGGMTEKTSVTESSLATGIFNPEPNVAVDAGLELDPIVIDNGSTMFEVTGSTDRVSQDIAFIVTAPNGNKVTASQVSPSLDGKFVATITTGGPLWKQDGFYTVTVQQFDNPKYIASTEVEIKDGVVIPEFGTIAAMILAVAIISIIAVSAKSRLSIIPRY